MDAVPPLVLYDLTPHFPADRRDARQIRAFYDHVFLAVSIQGLANRRGPRLYLRFNAEVDDFWLERARELWLGHRPIEEARSIDELLDRFADAYDGAVVWEERVPATSNLAATIAGVENLLCLRYDEAVESLYHRLVVHEERLAVQRQLTKPDGGVLFNGRDDNPDTKTPSTGSAKNDAYRWLIEQYVRSGKTNPNLLGYYIDAFWLQCGHVGWPQNHTLTNLDYVIAGRGVVWDLNVWEDESPVDDPGQKPGTDLETLKLLLRACNERLGSGEMIHAMGFTPWRYKYTDVQTEDWNAGGRHGGVATEWKTVEVLSCFNAYLDADALDYASMANASFFRHMPMPSDLPPEPKPTEERLRALDLIDPAGGVVPRNYYAHYVGDYDAAAWMYWNLPRLWNDPARGKMPLSWAFNPNLAERFPIGFQWTRRTRTPNDAFIAGDSGAGYVNPYHLSEPREYSGLPSGWQAWETCCRHWMEKWNLDVVGFVLDGNTPNMKAEGWDVYARIAPGGIVLHRAQREPHGLHNGVPYTTMSGDLPADEKAAADTIALNFSDDHPTFHVYRSVLKSPTWYTEVESLLSNRGSAPNTWNSRAVDMPALLELIRRHALRDQDSTPQATAIPTAELFSSPDASFGLYPVEQARGRLRIEHTGDQACWKLVPEEGVCEVDLMVSGELVLEAPGLSVKAQGRSGGTGVLELLVANAQDSFFVPAGSAPVNSRWQPLLVPAASTALQRPVRIRVLRLRWRSECALFLRRIVLRRTNQLPG